MTPSMLSRFSAYPAKGPLLAAISADSAYASPVMIAVTLAAKARAAPLSYGSPCTISSVPRLA